MNKQSFFFSGKSFALMAVFALATVAIIFYVAGQNAQNIQEKEQIVMAPKPTFVNAPQAVEAPKDPIILPGIEKKPEGFDFDDEMKLKLQNISDAYLEQAQYPSYSIPIHPDELSTKYLPDMPVATELPADLNDPNSPSLSILPSKFRYFTGEELSAIAQISGLPTDEASYVSAKLIMHGKTLGAAIVSPIEGKSHGYQLDFDPLGVGDIDWKENITIEVDFQLLGELYTRNITVEYLNSIAQVDDISAAEVNGEFLTVSVYVETDKPGYHRLEANLYDAESNQPLIHLTAEDQLASNNGELILKAHISALKASGSEGPYQLKDLFLRRLPSAPDYISEFGRAESTTFNVNGYRFSEYEDKPYINEKAQRIANELRNLGS